jgi:hypothetical protein
VEAFDGCSGVAWTVVVTLRVPPRFPAAASTATTTPPPSRAETKGTRNMRRISRQDEHRR